jgi:hypothetical protein
VDTQSNVVSNFCSCTTQPHETHTSAYSVSSFKDNFLQRGQGVEGMAVVVTSGGGMGYGEFRNMN